MERASPVTPEEHKTRMIRVIALSTLAFLITFSYSIARPATEALFLAAHTSRQIPYVWTVMSVAVIITMVLFARLLARVELIRLMGATAAVSGLLLALIQIGRAADVPFIYYGLYIWKEIYIVLLVETFYCYANAVFPIRSARWLYGFFGVISSLGSFAGNITMGRVLAPWLNTGTALWSVVPIAALMWLICRTFSRRAGKNRDRSHRRFVLYS